MHPFAPGNAEPPPVKPAEPAEPGIQPDFLRSIRKRRLDKAQKEEWQKLLLLTRSGGNISVMAKELGVNRCTIYRKMKRYNITCEAE